MKSHFSSVSCVKCANNKLFEASKCHKPLTPIYRIYVMWNSKQRILLPPSFLAHARCIRITLQTMKSSINVLIIRIHPNYIKWVLMLLLLSHLACSVLTGLFECVWWIVNLGQWALSKTITIVMPIGAEIFGEHWIQLKIGRKIKRDKCRSEMILIWQYNSRWCQIQYLPWKW